MSGFGSYATSTPYFGVASSASSTSVPAFDQVDDASDPFGRVESTHLCFARNGVTASRSKWTPPPPPSRPLFELSPTTPHKSESLFGSGSLFGTGTESQMTVTGGEFKFGYNAPPGSNNWKSDSRGVHFGTDPASYKTEFGTCGSSTTTFVGKKLEPSFGTAKPPRAPATNPFTKLKANARQTFVGVASDTFGGTHTNLFGWPSTTQVEPFAAKTVPANPFASKNNFSAKVAPNSTVNPFATTRAVTPNPFAPKPISCTNPFAPSSNSATNPFTVKVAPSSTANPFAATVISSISAPPVSTTDGFAVPWSTGWATTSEKSRGSASIKFKSGLRAPLNPTANPWSNDTHQFKSVDQAQSPSFSWSCWKKSDQLSAESFVKSSNACASEASSSSPTTTSLSTVDSTTATFTVADALVASPDTSPYGSGSFGAGLLEQKVKTALSNAPSSIELKVVENRSSFASSPSLPRLQPPSAKFAARLGLARQPLQMLPMRPVVQPRFPSRSVAMAPVRPKASQADAFRFSSSFSRLAISKKSLRIRVEPTLPMGASPSCSAKTEPVDEDDAQTRADRHDGEVADHRDEEVPSRVCPVLLNSEYFTEPSVAELQQLTENELASVENFVIGRYGYGKVLFIGATDVRGLHLDRFVTFSVGEVVVYPDDDDKPAIGCALNKPAIVDLHGISVGENESNEDFLERLKTHTQTLGAAFLGYSKTGNGGVWSFQVEHF